MASVTYNGVTGAAGGNIFKGVAFWVAQRVPTRNTVVDHIKNNGGEVVALEKDADILIADHARKDALVGSYSWKFVTESVEYGIIQVKDRYRIGPEESPPGHARPRGVAKSTRTPFTRADDAALAKWALSNSEHDTGNKLYIEFEKINPRHTWQSWRARYTKLLKPMGHDYLRRLANEAPESPTNGRWEAAVTPPVEHSAPNPDTERDDSLAREQFYKQLRIFRKCRHQNIEFEYLIGGRIVDLYELGVNVHLQKNTSPDQVDWTTVARGLGYDWTRNESVLDELQRCYQKNLADFWEAVSSFYPEEAASEEAASEEAASAEAGAATEPASHETRSPCDVPSSPPAQPNGRKRPLSSSPAVASKRRRLGQDDEIPSTPDDKIGLPTRSPTRSSTRSPTDASQSQAALESMQRSRDPTPARRSHSEELDARPIPLRLPRERVGAGNSPAAAAPSRRSSPNTDGVPPPQANTKAPRRSLPAAFRSTAPPGPREPAAGPQQAQASPAEAGDDNLQQIRECVENYVALGYAQPIVVEALKRTTMTPGRLAELVMESLRDGHGVPAHHEGVWTDRDDRGLRQVDAAAASPKADPEALGKAKKEYRRLMHKHGQDRIDLRRRFLAAEMREES